MMLAPPKLQAVAPGQTAVPIMAWRSAFKQIIMANTRRNKITIHPIENDINRVLAKYCLWNAVEIDGTTSS
jgi:hypothetical protein